MRGEAHDQTEALKAKVEDLEYRLGLNQDDALLDAFQRRGLSPGEARALRCLYAAGGRTVAKWALAEGSALPGRELQDTKLADVYACRIRAKLGKPLIDTMWGRGYRLTDEGLAFCQSVSGG